MSQLATVTGRTRIIPMIGHPIAQVQTPGPMNSWFAEAGIDCAIVPMDIRPEKIAGFFDVLRVTENALGCSVTMPHKQAAFTASDEVSERARRARSVNIIRRTPSGRLIGDMTDGTAMVSAMESRGIEIEEARILLIGTGAAGTAIAFELAERGAASLTLLDRDQMRVRAVSGELSVLFPDLGLAERTSAGQSFDIAVNASPLGMEPGDPLPFPVEALANVRIVADVVTKPAATPWLLAAQAKGLATQTGVEMALAQVPIQLSYLRLPLPATTTIEEKTG